MVGLLLLLVAGLQSASAQAVGEVESVGFNNTYRPDCWTPMVVRLRPQQNEPASYVIAVYQHDLDGDRPIYTRPITLNGSDNAAEQRFWMYFLPQPIEKGLPDPSNGGTLKDLQRELQVFLCTSAGKPIVPLPITSTLNNIDPYRDYAQQPRGAKLVVAVTDGASQPIWRDYQNASGLTEDVEFVTLGPKDLPEDPIGYEAIDSIVWFDADPNELEQGGQHKLQTLSDYIRFGGQLVICQPATDWQKTLNFGNLLPVTISGIATKNDVEPLRSMANPREPDPIKPTVDVWARQVGPFAFARATARPATVVESWIDWKSDGSYADASPYLVRMASGLGQVTWVAQDLGSPVVAGRNTAGWPYVWDRVFGWNNDTYVPPANNKDDDAVKARLDTYSPGVPLDLGAPLRDGLNFDSRGAWLIFLAIAFFVVYWLVAGPGGYVYLYVNKRASFSWFFFALSAIGATLVTVAVVKVVLRGPPQIRHLSFVRMAPDEPALVYSRFGLYIPRDGDQTLALNNTAHQGVSYLSAWAEHPQSLGDASEFPAPADYIVPIRDLDSTDAPALTVPYRSSMKKFQSLWIGDSTTRFTGKVKLDSANGLLGISGVITNATGQDFTDIYLAYHNGEDDRVIYIPKWARDTSINLSYDLGRPVAVGDIGNINLEARPGQGKVISDTIGNASVKGGNARELHWSGYWYAHYFSRTGGLGEENPSLADAYPMLSLFDRLPPAWNKPPDPSKPGSGVSSDRFELFRRGGRMLNASASVMAGQLLVLGTATRPLPVPIEVDGNEVGGAGTVLYQFLLPIDRGKADQPTTQP
jgi:hypothetical protein